LRIVAEALKKAEPFLELGFENDLNSWKDDGTALHAAANVGVTTTVKWLLEHGAVVNARGRMGRMPLHLAAERNTLSKTVEFLA
jgi:ankyrin repeat protein